MAILQQFLYEYPILSLVMTAFTIWMLVDAQRHGQNYNWFWIILFLQPIGPFIYFFVEMRHRFSIPGLGRLFERKTPLAELEYRVRQTPTMANHLDLAERLIDLGRYEEAIAPLELVRKQDADFAPGSFNLARCHYELGRSAEAEPLLARVVVKDPRWEDYKAWRFLLMVQEDLKQDDNALETARQLVKTSPRMEHKVLLAGQLARLNHDGEARLVLENAIQEQQFVTGPVRRVNRKWVKEAKRLLRDLSPT
jgi:hypothetical protein